MIAPGDDHDIDAELVEYLVVAVPSEAAATVVIDAATELGRRGVVTVLDAAMVIRDADGATQIGDAVGTGGGVPTHLGLLGAPDLELIATQLTAGLVGVIIVVEDTWASPLAQTARSVGGYVAGGDRIPARRLAEDAPFAPLRDEP